MAVGTLATCREKVAQLVSDSLEEGWELEHQSRRRGIAVGATIRVAVHAPVCLPVRDFLALSRVLPVLTITRLWFWLFSALHVIDV